MNDDDSFGRLSYKRKSYVIGYDLDAKMTLKGGLGALGVGEMWFPMTEEEYKEALELFGDDEDVVREEDGDQQPST